MDTWAEIEPRRWDELRRALRLLVWSAALMFVGCSFVALPLLIVGGRSLVRWAPSRAVREPAQLLVVGGIVDALVGGAFVVAALLTDEPDLPTAVLIPMATVSIITTVVLTVGWVRALRSLCVWAAASHIVAAWDRTIHRLPIAVMAIVIGAIGAIVSDENSLGIFVLVAVLWALWMIGHPTWWTYRLFSADLRPVTRTIAGAPPPPAPPSYWD